MRRWETSVWMIMCGSSSISTPNQERRNWWESFLFLEKYKKTFYASQIVRSRSRKRERILTEEKASHPSWSLATQENIESCQNHFLYALIAPPFPPLSPPIQCLPGSPPTNWAPIRLGWSHNNISGVVVGGGMKFIVKELSTSMTTTTASSSPRRRCREKERDVPTTRGSLPRGRRLRTEYFGTYF